MQASVQYLGLQDARKIVVEKEWFGNVWTCLPHLIKKLNLLGALLKTGQKIKPTLLTKPFEIEHLDRLNARLLTITNEQSA